MIKAPSLPLLRRVVRATVRAALIAPFLVGVGATELSAQSLNPSGLALADDEAIYDHLASQKVTTVFEVAQLLDKLGDPHRAKRAAPARSSHSGGLHRLPRSARGI